MRLADAAQATVAALDRGVAGHAYNIWDDQPVEWNTFFDALAATVSAPRPPRPPDWLFRAAPYAYDLMTSTIFMSNHKAKHDLRWEPAARAYRDGLAADHQMPGR